MPKRSASIFVVYALVAACAGSSEPRPEPRLPTEPDAAFVEEVARQRARVEADTCFLTADDLETCAWVEHTYAPDELPRERDASGEAILLVDSFPGLTTTMFRYRARIRGYYRTTPAGATAVPFTWRLPAALHAALEATRRPFPVPAWWLEPLADPVAAAYGDTVVDEVGHGATVFSILVEPNPSHVIIVLDGVGFDTFAPDLFCAPEDDVGATGALLTRATDVAASLAALIARENVRYVSYSAGWSMPAMRSAWGALCATPRPSDDVLRARLATLAPILDVLFATPGVVAAQAADETGDASEFPFDQRTDAFPNRVRVGYFTSLDSGLDALGRGPTSALDAWPGAGAADVYLNSGVLPTRPFAFNDTPLLVVDDFGTRAEPITRATTSWLTPLATSRLVHLRASSYAERAFDDALAQALLDDLVPEACPSAPSGRCAHQDPLRHAQIEAVRLGLLPARYAAP